MLHGAGRGNQGTTLLYRCAYNLKQKKKDFNAQIQKALEKKGTDLRVYRNTSTEMFQWMSFTRQLCIVPQDVMPWTPLLEEMNIILPWRSSCAWIELHVALSYHLLSEIFMVLQCLVLNIYIGLMLWMCREYFWIRDLVVLDVQTYKKKRKTKDEQ